MKIFVRASVAAAALLAATPTNAAFPADVTVMMDTTVDPCDDFYQYTCGNWLKTTTLPDDENSFTVSYDGIDKRNQAVIQDIIKEDWPLIGELWESCMAVDKMTVLGSKPLQRDLSRIAATATKKELATVAGDLGATGPSLFTGSSVQLDLHNASMNILDTGSPSLVLPSPSYYLDNSTFASVETPFRTYISTLVKLAGIETKDLKQAVDIVIKMETKLAEIQPTDEEWAKYYTLTYSEAAAKFPLTFAAMTQGMGLLEKSSITADSTMFFDSLPFMDRAEALFSAENLEELKLYYKFLYIHVYAEFLGEPFVAAKFAFFKTTLEGTPARPPRERVCTDALIDKFPDLIGKYYFLKAFDNDRQQNVELMIDAIEKAMGDHMEVLTWLDEPTRKQAESKLAKVTKLVGRSTQKQSYPYVLSRENYFDNTQTIMKGHWARDMAKINHAVDRTEWGMSAATVNALYSRQDNQMVFPAAILQPPYFNGSSHPVQNFGAIGAVIGHELTHGFDSGGRRYDGDGNKVNWWSDESTKEFETRADCMKVQYSKFPVTGMSGKPLGNVNGNLTINENIADSGGLSLAYDAYHEWSKSGAKFSSNGVNDDEVDKLFFVSYGQLWCTKIRDELQSLWLETDGHSPTLWRTNGVVMNSDTFAKTFQCKADSKMNPKTKCKLWQK